MNEKLLTSLVDALESINGCISVRQNGTSRHICIKGDVSTY